MIGITVLITLLFFCSFHDLVTQDYAQIVHNTMWADFLYYNKQHIHARNWYQNIIQECTLPYPLRSYSLLLFDMQQFSTLLEYKNQLLVHFQHDIEIQKVIALALIHEKKNQEAITLFMDLAERFPYAYEVIIPTAQILMQQGDLLKAKPLLEKVIANSMQKNATPLCMVLLAQIYLKEHKVDAAHAILIQCTTYQPSYAPAWLILGALEESRNNSVEALKAYRTFSLYSPGHNQQITRHMQALSAQKNNHPTLYAKNQLIIKQVLKLLSQKEYTTALSVIKQGLSQNNADVYLRALYVHTLVIIGAYTTALAAIAWYIQENPHDNRWWGTLHLLSLHPKMASMAHATLKNFRLQHHTVLWGYLYESDYALRIKEYLYAHDLYTQALCITDNEAVRAELYFMQALCGYELHNYQFVADAITNGLHCSCVHAPLYNLAAYYYAHIGKYTKAISLITHCCTLEPHNEHYQDTAAFIAYKQHKFTAVAPVYVSLHSKHSTDATIALHAAQLAFKQNNIITFRNLLAQAENHAYSKYEKRRIQACLHTGTI